MPITSGLQGGGAVRGGGGGGGGNILLTIIAVNQASQVLSQISKDVQGLSKSSDTSGKSAKGALGIFDQFFKGLKVGMGSLIAVAGALTTLEKAFEQFLATGERGAAFLQTGESFAQMMDYMSVGPDVLGKLRQMSQGTITDFQLMSYATTALAGASGQFGAELAKALPHILEIAKAANKANPALGSVDYQFQSLIIGLKRLSPRLVDNTGLQVKLGQSYEDLARKLGKSREELTAEEQQLAFLNATLKAGDRLLAQVGGTAESMTDPFNRLKAEVGNLGDALGIVFYPAAAKAAEGIAGFLDEISKGVLGIAEMGGYLKANNKELVQGAQSYEDYATSVIDATLANQDLDENTIHMLEAMRSAVLAGKDLTDANAVLGKSTNFLTDRIHAGYVRMVESLGILTPAEYKLNQVYDERAEAIMEAKGAYGGYTEQLLTEEEQVEKIKLEYKQLKGAMDAVHYAMTGYVTKGQEDYKKGVEDLTGDLEKYESKLRAIIGVGGFTSPEVTQGVIDISTAVYETFTRMTDLQDALKDGMIPKDQVDEAQQMIANMQVALTGYVEEFQNLTGLEVVTPEQLSKIGELAKKINDTKTALEGQKEALQRNTAETTYNIAEKMIMAQVEQGLFPDINNNGQAWDDAYGVLLKSGEALGLVDEQTAQYQEAVLNATTSLMAGTTTVEGYTGALEGVAGALTTAMTTGQNLGTILATLPKDITITIHLNTIGGIPELGTGGGGGGGKNKPYMEQFGGNHPRGQARIVGETGPELFIPPISGTVMPHSFIEMLTQGLGSGNQVSVTFASPVYVRSDQDIDLIAYKVAQTIGRRNR